MSEIANKYNGDINSYLKETFKSPKSETYKNYLIQKTRESTRSELSSLKDFLDMKKDLATSEDDKLQLMDLETSIDNNPMQNNQSNNIQDSNDIYREQEVVFAGWNIEEKVKVIKNFKFDMKNEVHVSPLSWEVTPLWNNIYEILLSRLDWWDVWKIQILYNPYWNTVQIFDEYRSRLIWEQMIRNSNNWYWHRDMHFQNWNYPSTQFNIQPYWDKWPTLHINLAFPNRK